MKYKPHASKLKNPSLIDFAVVPASSRSSANLIRSFARTLCHTFRLFFRSSSPLYPLHSFIYRFPLPLLRLIHTFHSLRRASLFCSPTERVIYCQQQEPQNFKPYACTFSACGFLHRALQCTRMYALYCPA